MVARAYPRPAAAGLAELLVDNVADALEGQQHAAALLASISESLGDGLELHRAIEALPARSPAFRQGFARRLQKQLERMVIA